MRKIFSLLACYIISLNIGFSQWQQIIGPYGASINVITIDPNTKYLYAGTSKDGILISDDNGSSWRPINNGLIENYGLDVFSIAIIGGNIYAGTIGGGIYISNNNGNSWKAINNGLTNYAAKNIHSIIEIGNNIFIGTEGGVFLSTNFGESWISANEGITNNYISSLLVNGNNIFASTNGGVFLSTNNGGNWISASNGLTGDGLHVYTLSISGNNIFAGTLGGGIFLSSNNGANWTEINNGLSNKVVTYIKTIGDNIYASTNPGVYMSIDKGNSWTFVNSDFSKNGMSSMIVSGDNIFAATTKGIFISLDNGLSWALMSNNLSNRKVSSIAKVGDKIFAGTYDGVFISNDEGVSWTLVTNNIHGQVKSIVSNGNNIFLCTTGGVFISSDNGTTWLAVNNGLTSQEVNALAIKGSNIFAGTNNGIFTSTDNGGNWNAVNNGIPVSAKEAFCFAVMGDNLFVGTIDGVYNTTNNGINWTPINNGLTSKWVWSLAVNSTDIFASVFNRGMYKSSNNGSNWNKVNDIVKDNGSGIYDIFSIGISGNNIYSTSNDGVFRSTDNGSKWAEVNDGLSTRDIDRILLDESYVFITTRNNGNLWRRSLTDFRNMSVSTNSLPIDSGAGSVKTFEITSDTDWNITSNQDWLTFSPNAGTGNATITLTAKVNPTVDTRSAQIIVRGMEVPRQYISVLQNKGTPILNVSTTEITISSSAYSTKTFEITSNTSWKADRDQNWILLSTTSGYGNSTITLTVAENPTISSRKAIVTLSGIGFDTKIVTLTQEGSAPSLSVSANTLTIEAGANSTNTFKIISNINWAVSSSEPWLSVSDASGSGNSTITVTAQRNIFTLKRTADIIVTGANFEPETLTFIQDETPLGINDLEKLDIQIFPNPVNDILFVKGVTLATKISIFDFQGNLIINKDLNENQVEVGSLRRGIYTIKFECKTGIALRRFVKK